MKPIATLAAVLILAGCGAMIRPTHVTADEISIRYDPMNSFSDVQARADAHCAKGGRRAELVNQWGGGIAARGATFRCV